jgi:hypothetical protein
MIQESARSLVFCEQRPYFTSDFFVIAAFVNEDLALTGLPFERCFK